MNAEVADLTLAIGALARRVRAAGASHGLSLTQRAVIARLAREGPATTSDLARAEGMKPQSMGAAVAGLEEMGLVTRRPHPTDGRQFELALTPEGETVREETRTAKIAWLAQAVSRLNEDERETLFRAGKILSRLGNLS